MTDIQFIAGVFTVGLCAAGVLVYRITRVQQDTIRDLTNKLMAKDYGEYKAYQQPVNEETAKPKRKRMSYWDDGDETEEEVQ
ncbi:hypothetical protein [Paenibacillus ottowii]|uniref:Uncharacterized protein n=1 Tax=Paenibacillus ottowii TaxID=2315729 RepID=A0ABY3B1C5_9BACL|nr:hypothetical protein [Paenibacillus ottowii]TQR97319.1 hypothetical protein FKV70_18990 [Paenibacillus ottowii]